GFDVRPKGGERQVRRDAAERDSRGVRRSCSDAARNRTGNRAHFQSSLYPPAAERSGRNRKGRLQTGGRSGPHFSVSEKANGRRFQCLQGKHADSTDPAADGAAPDRQDESIRAVYGRPQKRNRSAL